MSVCDVTDAAIHILINYWYFVLGPGVIRQLLDELEKSVKVLEDKFADKVKAVGVRKYTITCQNLVYNIRV